MSSLGESLDDLKHGWHNGQRLIIVLLVVLHAVIAAGVATIALTAVFGG